MRPLICIMCLCPYGAFALSLTEALQTALAQNPTLQAERENIAIADETKNQAVADFLPQVSVNANYIADRTSFNSGNTPASNSTPNDISLNLTQNLFNGRLIPALNAAGKLQAQSTANVENTTQNILLTVVTNYTAVLVAQDVSKQQENLVKNLTQQKEAAKVRFEYGDATKTDIALAEARLAAAQAQLLSAQNDIQTTRQALASAMGELIPTEGIITWPENAQEIGILSENIMDVHPQGRAAQLEIALQTANVKAVKGDFLPALTASASVVRNAGQTFFPDNTSSQAGVNLAIPLFQGGRNVSAYRQAVAERTAAEQTARQIRLDLEQNLNVTQANYALAQAEVAAFTAEVEAAELAAYGTTREAELGERSTLDVLDAQQDLLDANVRLVQAKAAAINGYYTVLAAQGRFIKNIF